MVVSGQRHVPAALTPRMARYLLYRRLGGPRYRFVPVPSPEFDPRTIKPVA